MRYSFYVKCIVFVILLANIAFFVVGKLNFYEPAIKTHFLKLAKYRNGLYIEINENRRFYNIDIENIKFKIVNPKLELSKPLYITTKITNSINNLKCYLNFCTLKAITIDKKVILHGIKPTNNDLKITITSSQLSIDKLEIPLTENDFVIDAQNNILNCPINNQSNITNLKKFFNKNIQLQVNCNNKTQDNIKIINQYSPVALELIKNSDIKELEIINNNLIIYFNNSNNPELNFKENLWY